MSRKSVYNVLNDSHIGTKVARLHERWAQHLFPVDFQRQYMNNVVGVRRQNVLSSRGGEHMSGEGIGAWQSRQQGHSVY